jgi:hypothetical protein
MNDTQGAKPLPSTVGYAIETVRANPGIRGSDVARSAPQHLSSGAVSQTMLALTNLGVFCRTQDEAPQRGGKPTFKYYLVDRSKLPAGMSLVWNPKYARTPKPPKPEPAAPYNPAAEKPAVVQLPKDVKLKSFDELGDLLANMDKQPADTQRPEPVEEQVDAELPEPTRPAATKWVGERLVNTKREIEPPTELPIKTAPEQRRATQPVDKRQAKITIYLDDGAHKLTVTTAREIYRQLREVFW